MNGDRLYLTVQRYEAAVRAVEQAGQHLAAEEIVEILAARAQVQKALKDEPGRSLKEWMHPFTQKGSTKPKVGRRQLKKQIKQLDFRLLDHAHHINQAVRLEDWQILLPPSEREWLRLFTVPPRWSERFDWLWQGMSIAFLTASFSILTLLVDRFFRDGPDAGIVAVIVPSVVALLASGGALTKTGRQAMEYILTSMNLSKEWWDEAICTISFLLMVSLICFWSLLPVLSSVYVWFGDSKQCAQSLATVQQSQVIANTQTQTVDRCKSQLISASKDYNRAISLNPDNAEAYYKLGRVYENLGRRKVAVGKYEIAVGYTTLQDDYALDAFNLLIDNAARSQASAQAQNWLDECQDRFAQKLALKNECRLERVAEAYLQEKKYTETSALLLANRSQDNSFSQFGKERHYQLLIYLGRAFLEQKSPAAAQAPFERAIKLQNDRGIAHCFLAQTLEQRGEMEPTSSFNGSRTAERVIREWEQCIAYSSLGNPDEAYWLGVAQQRLAAQGEQK